MKRIMPESDPMAWIEPDELYGEQKRIYLVFAPEFWGDDNTYPLWASIWPRSQNMMPSPLYYGFWRRWLLEPYVNPVILTEAINRGEADNMLEFMAKAAREAKGDKRVLGYAEELLEVEEAFAAWLYDMAQWRPVGGVITAEEFFDPVPPVVTPDMTDIELERIAIDAEHTAEAMASLFLVGAFEYLRRRRDEMRELAPNFRRG